ncbi:aminotransferase class IV [Solirubrum puertoriconensis]|uniref:branched-chain-amino-acid transaminase n=1 Tax=Solirubrum puertoriconensis TaxID=1751427 RepID=A0A9X0HLF8_SOLP1|nr:aminotransferase class IV [Solirubrum puertoriconensis]KUG08166.1 amino acid aminotransferase [Solirubrum puertoriconensis]
MNPAPYAYLRGDFVPLDQAFLHVSDLAVQRGYGIFDFLKVQDGHPLFLDYYLDRFYQSAELMELVVPLARPELVAVLRQLIGRNNLPLSGIKLLLTGGYSSSGYEPPAQANLIITQQPIALPTPEQLARGLRIISHEYVREFPAAKTINYTMGIRLLKRLQALGADEVLYHQQGAVTEFPRANFFIVRQDDTVVTPAANVLGGITRRNILGLSGRPYRIEEGPVTLHDVRQAKEAFLTSTTKLVMPVVQLDDHVIGSGQPGRVTLDLLHALTQLEQQQLTQSYA